MPVRHPDPLSVPQIAGSPVTPSCPAQPDTSPVSDAHTLRSVTVGTVAPIQLLEADIALIGEFTKYTARLLLLFHSSFAPDEAAVHDVLTAAYRAGAETLGIRAAQQWGADFRFPTDVCPRDLHALIESSESFQEFVTTKQQSLADSRLSAERVYAVFGADGCAVAGVELADFHRILEFATTGISVPLPVGFRRCTVPPPLRTKYVQVAPAVNKLIHDQHQAGTVVLIPLDTALQIPGIHFSQQHWTEKKDKAQGRIICDVANAADDGSTPLNGSLGPARDALRAEIEQKWGPIQHPTLPELMSMILSAADEFGWDDLILWKKDLQGAFNLLWFRPADVPHLAFLLTGSLVVLHLAGMFGWVGMPFAFDVVTRCLRALVRSVIRGKADMYVDDVMAVSPRYALHLDMQAAHTAICDLLGPKAVAPAKDESGRVLDWIGWEIDLDSRLVTLSHRNFLRTTYAFFFFDINAPVSLQLVQRLASLASRCSQLARQMRPFTKSLYDCAAQYNATHKRRHLTGAARTDVTMWRSFLLAVHLDPRRVARPIASFAARTTTLVIEYDSSLTAFAVGISAVSGDTTSLLAFTAVPSPFPPTKEARFQNTYEFIAVILGLLLARRARVQSPAFSLRGDSISSLQWAVKDRAASSLARRANIAYTLIACDIDAVVADTVHVPGVLNTVYDGLSRGKSAQAVGLDPQYQVDLPEQHPIRRFLSLCDPHVAIATPDEHLSLSAEFMRNLADVSFFS